MDFVQEEEEEEEEWKLSKSQILYVYFEHIWFSIAMGPVVQFPDTGLTWNDASYFLGLCSYRNNLTISP